MITLYNQMVWATVAGSVACFFVLGVCRLRAVDPRVKVWLCRLAALKFPLGLVGAWSVPVALSTWSPATATGLPAWVEPVAASVFALWAFGFAVASASLVGAWWRARATAVAQAPADSHLARRVGQWSRVVGLDDRCAVRVGDRTGPFVVSAPGTVLVLPEDASDFAIVHELAHVRHYDLPWSGVAAFAQAVFWFNPLVEILARELRLWQDVVADRAAMRATGTEPRAAADEVLNAVSRGVPAGAVGLGSDAAACARRFGEMFGQRRSLWALAVVPLVLALLVPVRAENAPKAQGELAPVAAPLPVIATKN